MCFSPTKLFHGLLLLVSLLLAACGGGGGSSGTVTPVNPPAAPTGVSATAGCNAATIYINWNTASGATGYNIYRSATTGVAGTKQTATAVTANSYTDSGLAAGKTYYYTVTAVNTGGESSVSTEISGATPGSPTCTQMGGSFQSHALTPSGVVTTVAGTAGTAGTTDGTGAAARFTSPTGTTTDVTNLYVADTTNNTIRKIVIATGVVSTVAGTAGASGSADGTGTAATFNLPQGITTDGANLYVADTQNHTIRQIVIATGVVTTVAGAAGTSGSADGTGSAARFNVPAGITTDGVYLYVADTGNHAIRKIVITTGVVTTLAGTAGTPNSTDGTGGTARFNFPQGITTDATPTNLYVADTANHTIRKIVITTGVVTTLAGTAGTPNSTDGTGGTARFNFPQGITSDGTNLFINDTANHTIRQIVITMGVVTTVAGAAGTSGSADGTGGTGGTARFNTPVGITTDGTYLYAVDTGNQTIRRIQ